MLGRLNTAVGCAIVHRPVFLGTEQPPCQPPCLRPARRGSAGTGRFSWPAQDGGLAGLDLLVDADEAALVQFDRGVSQPRLSSIGRRPVA